MNTTLPANDIDKRPNIFSRIGFSLSLALLLSEIILFTIARLSSVPSFTGLIIMLFIIPGILAWIAALTFSIVGLVSDSKKLRPKRTAVSGIIICGLCVAAPYMFMVNAILQGPVLFTPDNESVDEEPTEGMVLFSPFDSTIATERKESFYEDCDVLFEMSDHYMAKCSYISDGHKTSTVTINLLLSEIDNDLRHNLATWFKTNSIDANSARITIISGEDAEYAYTVKLHDTLQALGAQHVNVKSEISDRP